VLTVSLLDRRVHDRKSFHCGIEPLDHYFHTQAAQDMAKRAAVCYVLEDEDMPGIVCGFYTLSNLSVELSEIPVAKRDSFPRYPQVPAILLGRLAVDQQRQGTGIGEHLLIDALQRALESSKVTGAAVIVVDAKNKSGRGFYLQFGFKPFTGIRNRLFITMATVAMMAL
jgi:GNAT superfamily N-acetyltransferase